MSEPLVKWHSANLPKADVKRLAELEAMAKELGARFYTIEVTPSLAITLSHHGEKILTKRMKGAPDVPFDMVLDEALKELKAHILKHAKP